MKVLFVTQLFDPTRGGGEVVFNLAAKELAKRDHTVYVLRHKVRDEQPSENLSPNLEICDVDPTLDYAGGLPFNISQSLLYLFNAVRYGLKIVKDKEIDVIHANTYVPVFIGAFISKLTGRPLVITIHDVALMNGLSFWKRWMNQFKASFLHSLVGYAAEFLTINTPADIIVTVSEASRDDILSVRKNCSVFVIPNGLDVSLYKVQDSSIKYGDEVVFIGRAVYYKNLEVVLKAMKTVVQKNPNAKLIVIGTGPMTLSWKKLAIDYGVEKNVVFKGHVSEEEKINILERATSLVLPSIWEGFGMVLLEAWALKKPVIVARVRPLSDLVEHERDGFHAHPFEPAEWAEHLDVLLKNKNLAKQMGEAGYNKLVKNFTAEEAVRKLEILYRELSARGTG